MHFVLMFWLTAGINMPLEPIKPPPPPKDTQSGIRVEVQWTVTEATRSCFFFSGPGKIGRDDHLGTAACVTPNRPATVSFDGNLFVGSTGADARLVRHSLHTFGGQWTVTETITGNLHGDGRFSGRYDYTECKSGGACPGSCRLKARVSWIPKGKCGGKKIAQGD